jgi:integrase
MHLRSIKVFGRWLAKHKLAPADNCFATLEFVRVRDKQIRYLTEDEFKRIWQTEKIPEYRFVYLVALLTALRLSDILSLKVSQIDFRNWTITVVQQKTQRRLTIPVHPELREPFLHAQIAAKGRDAVWEKQRSVGAISHHFTKVAVRAKVDGISFHGLRRTCASWLVQKGVPILNVSTLLGHSSVVLTQKMYGSLAPSNLQNDVLQLSIPTGSIPLKIRH